MMSSSEYLFLESEFVALILMDNIWFVHFYVIGLYSKGDAMYNTPQSANGLRFTTYDRDHDLWAWNCAQSFMGGWWYAQCHEANLNGLYLGGANQAHAQGITWYPWHGHYYSLKTTKMMLRCN